jgi:hypothetical protein
MAMVAARHGGACSQQVVGPTSGAHDGSGMEQCTWWPGAARAQPLVRTAAAWHVPFLLHAAGVVGAQPWIFFPFSYSICRGGSPHRRPLQIHF